MAGHETWNLHSASESMRTGTDTVISSDSKGLSAPLVDPRIDAVLDEYRPRLLRDGAEISVLAVTDDGLLRLRVTGRNSSCPMALFLLKSCLTRTLRERLPELTQVELECG